MHKKKYMNANVCPNANVRPKTKTSSQSILLVLLVGIMVIAVFGCQGQEAEPADASPAEERVTPVAVAEVIEGNIGRGASYSGDLELSRETSIVPKISGKIASVNVKLGARVTKGQRLFTIDDTDIQNEILRAEVSIRSVEAQLNQAKAQAKNGIARAELGVKSATDAYEDAKTGLERMQALYAEGAIPKVELESAETRYTNAKLQLNSANEDLEMAQQQEAIAVVEASLAQAVTGLEIARSQLANTVMTAPVSGIVNELNIGLGELASQQMAAVKIVSTNPILVKIPIPENSIGKIKVGDLLPIAIPAMQKQLQGQVTHIALAADRQSKMFAVELQIENDGSLRAGMMARMELSEQNLEPSILVANDAIIMDGHQARLFIVQEDRAIAKEVTVGRSSAYWTEVIDGLEVGQQVIVKGKNLLDDNGKVRVTEVVVIDEN